MTEGARGLEPLIEVEVCWVESGPGAPPRVCRHTVQVPARCTVGLALQALGRADLTEALAQGTLVAAVFGEHAIPDSTLHRGDRIELLSGIQVDAKVSRARRAEVQRARRGDARWQRR